MIKADIIEAINKYKMIVIVRGVDKETLMRLCEAMYEGGVRLVECTFDMRGEETVAETAEKIRMLTEAFDGRMLIGAGTVVNLEQAKAALDAGAKYLISPHTDKAIIDFANENGIASIPGAMTPTEIMSAYNMGADFVKVFPNDIMGLAYIKTVMAPLSAVPLLAVGGVNAENVADFLATGVRGVGVGGCIVNKKLIAAGDFAAITEAAKKMTAAIGK